jgi:excisionase family DNA binding protein
MAQTSTQPQPELLDWDGAANRLGCTPRMVRKLVETRQIASVKVGRLVRIHPKDIDRYIESHRREAV